MKWALAFVVLVGCKEPGEITVDFDLEAVRACGPSAQVLVYGVRGTTCDACTCGGCFGRGSAQVIGCRIDCALDGIDLDLDAGHWAIVLETRDDDDRFVGTQCVEIDVDRDGTSSRTASGEPPTCADACL